MTEHVRHLMGGDAVVARWVRRQRSKALHLGTYEAAIHNMLGRIGDEADHGNQFYLYRVHLKPTIAVRDAWLIDPSDFLGDVMLDKVCPPGIDVARYLNYHEDPGGLSLALGREAISSTQQIAIPQPGTGHHDWTTRTVSELGTATDAPSPPNEFHGPRRFRFDSPLDAKAREMTALLASRLPINLRSEFQASTRFSDTLDHETWARYAVGVVDLIENPGQVLAELDTQDVRRF